MYESRNDYFLLSVVVVEGVDVAEKEKLSHYDNLKAELNSYFQSKK